jgi:anti-sigma factor RsiW
MVTGTHPDDTDLFDYVEGDLPARRRDRIEVHLASCADCADHVARVTAGRDALRGAQFLQLPPRRREGMFLNLPEQRRPARRGALSPKQLVAVLTPVAVVAAVVVALVTTGGGNGNEQAGRAVAGETSLEADQSTQGGGEALPVPAQALKVAGPADAVAAQLRSSGIDARVVGNRVEVRGATRAEVDRALRNRRTGKVEIVIK